MSQRNVWVGRGLPVILAILGLLAFSAAALWRWGGVDRTVAPETADTGGVEDSAAVAESISDGPPPSSTPTPTTSPSLPPLTVPAARSRVIWQSSSEAAGFASAPAKPSGLIFSPDGSQLAWLVDGEGWHLRLPVDVRATPSKAVVSATGELTALAWDVAGLQWLTGDRRGRLRTWALGGSEASLGESETAPDPEPSFEIRLTGLSDPVDRVAWGEGLMASSSGGHLWLWQSEGRRLVASWQGHGQSLSILVFRHDGRALLSADPGGALKLWAPSGRPLKDFSSEGFSSIRAAGFDPFGWVVAWAGGPDGRWGLWREAGGWWHPEQAPLDARSSTASIAVDGSHVLWASAGQANLFSIRQEQLQLEGLLGSLVEELALSKGGQRVAWVEGGAIQIRGLAAPAAVHP